MKKSAAITLIVILVITLILALAACGEGDTAPADTPAPTPEATPTPTPEPTPEPCQHEWVAAECETPETCSKCDEIQGTPLGHDLTDANYQEPATCLVCEVTEGDVLTPGAELYGLGIITEVGVPQRMVTMTGRNSLLVFGEVTLVDVTISDSYEDHEAEEGYEFILASLVFTTSDPDARSYGFGYLDALLDYYTYDPSLKATGIVDEEGNYALVVFGNVNYYGVERDLLTFTGGSFEWSGPSSYRVATLEITYAIQVPVDYDGVIIAFGSSRYRQEFDLETFEDLVPVFDLKPAGNVFDHNTLFFRLRG